VTCPQATLRIIGVRADIRFKFAMSGVSRFDSLAKYDCKIKESAVGPGVVPRRSDFKNLDCQTVLSALTDAKRIFPHCKTVWIL
jgi:hypothetical protein